MTTRNMGSSMNPEGLPHWTMKALLAKSLRHRLEYDIPFIAGYFGCCSGGCHRATGDVPYPAFENLLEEVTSVEVEGSVANRSPDIVLHRDNMPPRVIEIVDTSILTPQKLADYRHANVDVFVFEVHDRESVEAQLRSPVPLVAAPVLGNCRQQRRERLRELVKALESTPDATFGVQQPKVRFPETDEELARQLDEMDRRTSLSTTYVSQGLAISHEDVRPSYQKFVVAGKTVSKAGLFSIIGFTKLIADINGLSDMVGDDLWEMLAKVDSLVKTRFEEVPAF